MPDLRERELTGWGRTTSSWARTCSLGSVEEVATEVRRSGERGVLARGLGSNYGDAAQNGGGLVVAPISPSAPIELDRASGLVRVSAGTSLGRILHELLPLGRTLPVLPGTARVTVGGAISADVHGKNHHVHGSFGQWTSSLDLVDGRGEVRSLSAPDPAFRATVGGMGLTGVIASAVLQTRPVTSSRLRVRTRRFRTLPEVMAAMRTSSATYHVAWVDAVSRSRLGRGVLEEAEHAEGEEALEYTGGGQVTVPSLPTNLVRPGLVREFNRLRWHRAPRDGMRTSGFRQFFHQLDVVRGWPGLYGPRGFLQWQFVVPDDAESFVELALRTLASTGTPPALAVLKRMGPGRAGLLSFPRAGWTLAVDLPADPNVAPVLDRLDSILAAAGGRVYLAKDARLSRRNFEQMYPELPEWRAARYELDPRGVFASDLGRRLGLS